MTIGPTKKKLLKKKKKESVETLERVFASKRLVTLKHYFLAFCHFNGLNSRMLKCYEPTFFSFERFIQFPQVLC